MLTSGAGYSRNRRSPQNSSLTTTGVLLAAIDHDLQGIADLDDAVPVLGAAVRESGLTQYQERRRTYLREDVPVTVFDHEPLTVAFANVSANTQTRLREAADIVPKTSGNANSASSPELIDSRHLVAALLTAFSKGRQRSEQAQMLSDLKLLVDRLKSSLLAFVTAHFRSGDDLEQWPSFWARRFPCMSQLLNLLSGRRSSLRLRVTSRMWCVEKTMRWVSMWTFKPCAQSSLRAMSLHRCRSGYSVIGELIKASSWRACAQRLKLLPILPPRVLLRSSTQSWLKSPSMLGITSMRTYEASLRLSPFTCTADAARARPADRRARATRERAFRQRPGVHVTSDAGLAGRAKDGPGPHPTRQANAERACRELPRKTARRMPQCQLVPHPERRADNPRNLTAGV